LALPVLVVVMVGVYQAAVRLLGPETAWYAGFWVYWPVWCVLFPWCILRRRGLRELFEPRRLGALEWSLLILPPAITFIGRFVMDYGQPGLREVVMQVLMSFANGTLEEVLWRGTYVKLFPGDKLWGFAWPTAWFALWHSAPGSVSQFSVWTLMAGAAVFGACWGWLALKTGSIRYSAISHTLAGLARVLA
jgi:membrane protease YdiL (CAAX protease family)